LKLNQYVVVFAVAAETSTEDGNAVCPDRNTERRRPTFNAT